jgi:integrase
MLTDTQIKKAKPAEKAFKLTDGGGLHVFVSPSGGKLWRLRYEFGGKEKLLSIGPYPDVPLAKAREARQAAKDALREGRDPSILKKQHRLVTAAAASTTFESVAREWHGMQTEFWTKVHSYDVLHSFERDVFPTLGLLPIGEITAPDVLNVLRAIEQRPAKETARRIRQRMSAVFVFAIASGRATTDPAAIVQGAMAPLKKGRQPAVTDLVKAREMLRAAEASPASPVTKLALRLLALTAVRPGTLVTTPWQEINEVDEETPVWWIPAERMKLRLLLKEDEARAHLVPLSRQAVEALTVLRRLTGRAPLLFPNTRHAHKPMSTNALNYLLNRSGYHHKHVPHGWRATFSTVMNERFKADRQIIDLMLAHTPKDKVEGAYNRAAHLERRAELAQEWADLIMKDQVPAEELVGGPRQIRG